VKISQLLSWTQNQLRFSADDYSVEAEILIKHALKIDKVLLYSSLDASTNEGDFQALNALVNRRVSGEPISYITGYREFYGLKLMVSPAVLVPRQETESLVEKAIEFLQNNNTNGIRTIVDVGTGSGAIAIAISSQLPLAKIYATDKYSSALAVARTNVKRQRARPNIQLIQCDLLIGLREKFDMIVSNLPYIPTDDIPQLPLEVQAEPIQALDGGSDGLALIARLIEQAPQYLKSHGYLCIEVSPQQVPDILSMTHSSMPDCTTEIIKDLYGSARIVAIKTPNR
jgi:release factor glutamine methyltransferase